MKWLSLLIVVFAAVFTFDAKVGLEKLNPKEESYLLGRGSDRIADYLTWNYFRRAHANEWPDTIGYAFPQEISPIFTNIVPLIAFPVKWLIPDESEPFQYFGWWYLANFLMMGVSGYYLLWSMKIRQPLILGMGSIFFFLHLAFFERLDHPALIHQWTIILAFIPFLQNWSFLKNLLFYLFLSGIAATTHPYMLPFAWVFPIAFSFHRFRKNKDAASALLIAILPIFISVCLLWIQGAFAFERSMASSGGFGYYATNLNTFYNNLGKTRMPFDFSLKYAGSYEGMAYLGAGLMGLLLFVVSIGRTSLLKKMAIQIKAYWVLIVTILAFAVFSMSNIWTFHNIVLIEWPDLGLERIFGIFRSSGRYIWPLFYALIAALIWSLNQIKWSTNFKTAVLFIVLCIQSWDLWEEIHQKLPDEDWPQQMEEANWRQVLEPFDQIVWYPPFQRDLRSQDDASQFVYWANQHQLPITAGHLPRPDLETVSQYKQELAQRIKNPNDQQWEGALIITEKAYVPNFKEWLDSELTVLREKEGYILITQKQTLQGDGINNFSSFTSDVKLESFDFLPDWVLGRDSGYMIMLAHDEASSNLSAEFMHWAERRGSHWSTLPFRAAAISIYKDGKLIYEEIKQDTVQASILLFDTYNTEILSVGGEPSSESWMKLGSNTFKPMRRGINIFHWPHPDSSLRIAQFDTYISELLLFEDEYHVN